MFFRIFLNFLIVFFAESLFASVYYVSVKGDDSNSGKSWKEPFATISKAIAACSSAGGGEVWVAKGTYYPDSSMEMKNGVAVYGGFNGSEAAISERQIGVETIIDGQSKIRIFSNRQLNASAKIDSLIFENAFAVLGAAIYNSQGSSPTISNCVFRKNKASGEGGAICNKEASMPHISNCKFYENSARRGGAVMNLGNSHAIVENCRFESNAAGERGGAVANMSSSATIKNCDFIGNTAKDGGALSFNFLTPSVINCNFQNNSVTTDGGAIYDYGSSLTIRNCKFYENKCGALGGAVFLGWGVFVTPEPAVSTIQDCDFFDNTGGKGGGICVSDSYANISNTSFVSNRGTILGGGIFNYRTQSVYVNCTVAHNTAPEGGGMENLDNYHPKFYNCTVVFNSAEKNGGGVYNTINSSPTFYNSIIWGNNINGRVSEIENNSSSAKPYVVNSIVRGGFPNGEKVFDFDPLASAAAYNGGNSLTCALADDSPAKGASDSQYQPKLDQRGVARKPLADLGAYEISAAPQILKQPESISGYEGCSAEFSVQISGDAACQWQYSDDGVFWRIAENSDSKILKLTEIPFSFDGRMYRCIVANGGIAVSEAAKLSVRKLAKIERQPKSKYANDDAEISVSADGFELFYQWQKYYPSKLKWANLAGENSSVLKIGLDNFQNNDNFRCLVSNTSARLNEIVSSVSSPEKIRIKRDISDGEAYERQQYVFSVSAESRTGKKLYYSWYVDKNDGRGFVKSGNSRADLNVTAYRNMDGFKYFCRISDGEFSEDSNVAALSVLGLAKITSQPKSVTGVYSGKNASVAVKASGSNLQYQWQFYDKSERSWIDIDGANSPSLKINNVSLEDMNTQYRCVVFNGGNSVISSASKLTVYKCVSITRQPEDVSTSTGMSARFSVAATGQAKISYAWQYSDDNAKTWNYADKATSPTLTLSRLTKDFDSRLYRCVVSNGGGSVASEAATLSVVQKTELQTPVTREYVFDDDYDKNIRVAAKAEPPIFYVWEEKLPTQKNWEIVEEGSLELFESDITYSVNCDVEKGTKYRCTVWSGASDNDKHIVSREISVETCPRTTVEYSPKSVLKVYAGGDKLVRAADSQGTLIVAAKGTGTLKYQWQESFDGKAWTEIEKAVSSTYRTPVLRERDFDKSYRCKVSNTAGTVYSIPVKIEKLEAVKDADISLLPDIVCRPNDTAKFEIRLNSDGFGKAAYLWQVSADGGKTWRNAGSSQNFLLVKKPSVSLSGNKYKCLVSNAGNGSKKAESMAATLTVIAPAVIASHPKSQKSIDGENAVFECRAAGYNLMYRWEISRDNGRSWATIEGATKSTLSIKAETGNVQVRCSAWSNDDDGNILGAVVSSRSAVLSSVAAAKIGELAFSQIDRKETNPSSLEVYCEYPAVFTVKASGGGVKFQWYRKAEGGGFIAVKGAVSATFKLSPPSASVYAKETLRCMATNRNGEFSSSDCYDVEIEYIPCALPKNLAGCFAKLGDTAIIFSELSRMKMSLPSDYGISYIDTAYSFRRTSPSTGKLTLNYTEFDSGTNRANSVKYSYNGEVFLDGDGQMRVSLVEKSGVKIESAIEIAAGAYAPVRPSYGTEFITDFGTLKIFNWREIELQENDKTLRGTYSYSRKNSGVGIVTASWLDGTKSEISLFFENPSDGRYIIMDTLKKAYASYGGKYVERLPE